VRGAWATAVVGTAIGQLLAMRLSQVAAVAVQDAKIITVAAVIASFFIVVI
jgi:hypothetical protein